MNLDISLLDPKDKFNLLTREDFEDLYGSPLRQSVSLPENNYLLRSNYPGFATLENMYLPFGNFFLYPEGKEVVAWGSICLLPSSIQVDVKKYLAKNEFIHDVSTNTSLYKTLDDVGIVYSKDTGLLLLQMKPEEIEPEADLYSQTFDIRMRQLYNQVQRLAPSSFKAAGANKYFSK